MSVNRAIISGYLARDAEARRSQSGTTVLTFGVAVNERRKNQKSGEWEDYPNFIDCVMMGKRAEAIQGRLVKGALVTVDGQLRQSRWETRDGDKRSKVEILVNEIVPPMKQEEPKRQYAHNDPVPKFEEVPSGRIYDEDIPF